MDGGVGSGFDAAKPSQCIRRHCRNTRRAIFLDENEASYDQGRPRPHQSAKRPISQDVDAKQDLEPLDRVLGAARHLLALINDILDLSKIEAGRMELHLESFPLAPLIEAVAKTIEPMATKNANRIVIDCPPDLGTIHVIQSNAGLTRKLSP
jgi:signal transduction histidine kinase